MFFPIYAKKTIYLKRSATREVELITLLYNLVFEYIIYIIYVLYLQDSFNYFAFVDAIYILLIFREIRFN